MRILLVSTKCDDSEVLRIKAAIEKMRPAWEVVGLTTGRLESQINQADAVVPVFSKKAITNTSMEEFVQMVYEIDKDLLFPVTIDEAWGTKQWTWRPLLRHSILQNYILPIYQAMGISRLVEGIEEALDDD